MSDRIALNLEVDWTVLPNLIRFVIPFSEEFLRKRFNNPRMLSAMQFRYGLVGDGRLMSLREAGERSGVTQERVRQYRHEWIHRVRRCLSGDTLNPRSFYYQLAVVPNELVTEYNDLLIVLRRQPVIFTDREAIQFFQKRYADPSISSKDIPAINLLLEVMEFSRLMSTVRLKDNNVRMAWVMDESLDQHLFWKVRAKIERVMGKATSTLTVTQLADEINQGKEPGIDIEFIRRVCATYRNIELLGEDVYYGGNTGTE